ncbi:MAG: hypothetical protein AAGG02_04035 [Cyanobacteria bacterium P01_H01_bin.15]
MSEENFEQNGDQAEGGALATSGRQPLELTRPEHGRLPNNRPIEVSHLNVVETFREAGERPVTTSGIDISSQITVSGNRPIAKSHLQVSETYAVMGNRPVASNQIDDPALLMGYID